MSWRCRACGRTYDHPPGACSCGSSAIEPDDDDDGSRFSLAAVETRLLHPERADRSLTSDDSRIIVAFRVLVVVSLVVLAVAVLLLLV